MKVAVIGTGHVGLPFALSLVEKGVDAVGVDKDPDLRKTINEDRTIPFKEPGYDSILESSDFEIKENIEDVKGANYYLVTVGTPLKQHVESDLDNVNQVLNSLEDNLEQDDTIIFRSTLAPKTTQYIKNKLEQDTEFTVGENLYLAYCPERITQGNSKEELEELPQIIGAQDERSFENAKNLFGHFDVEILRTEYVSAELAKLINNASRYTYFAVANSVAKIAMDHEVNPHHLLELTNYDYPRPIQDDPGFAGGPCLRKDFGMITESNRHGDIFHEAWRTNESLPLFLVEKTTDRFGSLSNKDCLVLGYTFKRDSDDPRDSLTKKFLRYLFKENPGSIAVSDPFIEGPQLTESFADFRSNYLEALEDADVCFVCTNHSEYENNSDQIISRAKEEGVNIVDIWDALETNQVFVEG